MCDWDLDNGRMTGECGPYRWPAGYKDNDWNEWDDEQENNDPFDDPDLWRYAE